MSATPETYEQAILRDPMQDEQLQCLYCEIDILPNVKKCPVCGEPPVPRGPFTYEDALVREQKGKR